MLKKRIIAFLIAAAATAVLTLGITAAFPPVFSDGSVKEGLCFETTGICPDTVVASVDGVGVPADMYFYMLCTQSADMDNMLRYYTGAPIDWTMELGEGQSIKALVKEGALSLARQQLALEKMAKEYGVTLTENDLAAMADSRAKAVESLGSEEAYLAELNKMGLREETYVRLVGDGYLYNGLAALSTTQGSALCADTDTLMAYAAEQGYITADHILLKTVDDQMQPLDAEAVAAQKALAEDIAAKLAAGDHSHDTFAALADQYGEDPGRLANPNGYTFTYGEMVQEFDDAARALAEGEISGVVESVYGYHILYRLPLDANAAEMVRQAYFEGIVTDYIESCEAVVSPEADSMDPQVVYEAMVAAQTNG